MAEVRLENLTKDYGDAPVLAGLSLTVHDGELFALVGPSGCGKSTLLHLLAGLMAPSAGRILFDGQDVTSLEPRARDVAVVFQSYALYPHMTVEENLAFPLRVAGVERGRLRQEVGAVARRLGIEALLSRRPRELSGGQRQRVALGRALIRKPRVFLMDEPLSNLDAPLRAGMRAELRRLHDELAITMVYVTHDHTEAMTLGDRVAVMEGGTVRQVGTPEEIYRQPADAFVAGFIGHPPMNLVPGRVQGGLVVAGALHWALPPGHPGGLRDGDPVRVGIRPGDLRVVDIPAAGNAPASRGPGATGTVRLVEPTGGRIWVTIEVDQDGRGETLVGLADDSYRGRPGTRAALRVDETALHIFDATTGCRLGAEGEQ